MYRPRHRSMIGYWPVEAIDNFRYLMSYTMRFDALFRECKRLRLYPPLERSNDGR